MNDSEDLYRLVGTTVAEKYAVEKVAGSGGFAIVYRARHLLWQRPVALKVFKVLENVATEVRQKLVDDFHKEGALLADLSERSSAIAQARDVGMLTTASGEMVPYMVLEWLEGRSLEEILASDRGARRRYSFEEAFALLSPAIEALALAHSRGIAHRDVKPANLFVVSEPDGRTAIKLLDFGIAKVVQDARKEAGEFAKTTGNLVSFTPLYGAPEQFSRSLGATGPWTDVFAIALILVEMMIGYEPLQGDDIPQVAFASTNPTDRPTPRRRGVQVSDAVEAVFERALAVRPQDRFASCSELLEALVQAAPEALGPRSAVLSAANPGPRVVVPATALGSTSPGTFGDTQSLPQTAAPKKSSALLFGSLIAIGVLGAGAAYLKLRTDPPDSDSPIASVPATPPSVTAAPVDAGKSCPKDMILIEAAQFFMGSRTKSMMGNESPEHQVTLDAYCIDKHEVTVERFVSCTRIGKCRFAEPVNVFDGITLAQKKIYDPVCSLYGAENGSAVPEGKGNYPINCVDYDDAKNFCEKMGLRLPTEAEWEHAARGSDSRVYPWPSGEPGPELLNGCDSECVAWGKKHYDPSAPLSAMYASSDGYATTAPVGSFPKGASVYGLQDMTGNVWEWVADYYADYPAEWEKTTQDNPKGPATGTDRVLRGGSWNSSDKSWMRPSFRFHYPPDKKTHGIGFRCAATPG